MHGFGASLGHWRHNLPVLGQHHLVYALDLLGFGGSEKVQTAYQVALWGEQVYDFWQTFIRQPVVLVGNSLGSLVCLEVAATHPEIVAGVAMLNLPDASVLTSTWPQWCQRAIAPVNYVLRPVLHLLGSLLTLPPIFNPFFGWIRQPAIIGFWAKQAYTNPEAVTDELVEILSAPAYDRGAARALAAMTQSRSSDPAAAATVRLPRLQMPLLLIWGQQDRLVPSTLAPLFCRYNAQLQLVELATVGHCPHDESPEQVNQLLLNWMATHWGASGGDRSQSGSPSNLLG